MAERRMFAKTIVLSDAFLDLPMSARCLYFTLGMLADDDGFINSPRSIMRQCGASDDDMRILMAKKFVIAFETGVVVIKHWRLHNYIRKDTYNETSCLKEKATLYLDDQSVYRQRAVDGSSTQVRLGKDSIDKVSTVKGNNLPLPPPEEPCVFAAPELPERLDEAMQEWLAYKRERNESYKPIGLRTLYKQVDEAQKKYGEEEVIRIIRNCIASGYKGITLDKLKSQPKSSNPFLDMLKEDGDSDIF